MIKTNIQADSVAGGVFLGTLIFTSGFYEYSGMIAGVMLSGGMICLFAAKKLETDPFRIYKDDGSIRLRWQFLIPSFLIVYFWITCLYAADKGMAVAGGLKFTPLILWMYLCLQMEGEERDKVLGLIPYSGAVMVVLSLILYPAEYTRQMLWQADRLGGFFQYSNSLALYLLLGLHILAYVPRTSMVRFGRPVKLTAAGVLCLGILLTGSRSILLIAIVWAVVTAIRKKELRKGVSIFVAGSLVFILIYACIRGSYQNIARILTIYNKNSTILGRILYAKDGIRMLAEYPFGMGWQGYYRMQPALQHGVYTTRYVHNEYIQAALDLGVIPALLLIGYLALQLIKGKQDEAKKGALLLIAAAALTDFHMQYLVIVMAAALCLDLGQDEKARKGKQGSAKENIILMFIPLFAFLYFLVAFAAFSIGNDEAGLKFYPYYTDARIRQLEQETSPEKAGVLAGEVLKLAPCSSKAYISLAAIAALKADSEGMCDNMDKAIDCARYDTDCYRLYDRFLSDMILDDRVSRAEAERLTEIRQELPGRLEALKEDTDPLAYMLRDKPVFSIQ